VKWDIRGVPASHLFSEREFETERGDFGGYVMKCGACFIVRSIPIIEEIESKGPEIVPRPISRFGNDTVDMQCLD
jgi:hypothetical protein